MKGQFVAKIIPYRGAWVEFENDAKNILWVRLDRKKKFLATVFLRALGYSSDEDIIRQFFKVYQVIPEDGQLYFKVDSQLIGKTVREDIYAPGNTRAPLVKSGTKIDQDVLEKLQSQKVERIKISTSDLSGAYSLTNVKGKVKAVEELTAEQIEYLITRGEPF